MEPEWATAAATAVVAAAPVPYPGWNELGTLPPMLLPERWGLKRAGLLVVDAIGLLARPPSCGGVAADTAFCRLGCRTE